MNIALTYFCNQKCSYCFGMDAMLTSKKPEAKEITLPNLKKVMAFMKKSGVARFNMIGGEPTLHSKFEEIYEAISDNGFSVMIFSNGVIDKKKVDFLRKKDTLDTILLNIRHPSEYSDKDWGKIGYTLHSFNSKVILSFRIYKFDFDPTFLFDLIDKYKLQRVINWAPACVSLVKNNDYLKLEEYEKAVERMVKFSRISKKRRIDWYSDSGWMLCAFSNGKLEELRQNVNFKPIVNCYPAVEVTPDLRVFRCYGMASKSRPGLKITDFKNLQETERYFFVKSLPFKRIGTMDKCYKCEHIISQRCGGGCMAHILKHLPNLTGPIF